MKHIWPGPTPLRLAMDRNYELESPIKCEEGSRKCQKNNLTPLPDKSILQLNGSFYPIECEHTNVSNK